MAAWYVYMSRCADGSLYTGIAVDLKRRMRQHNGELPGGSAYCRSRRPVALAWSCRVQSRPAALRKEYAIKQLSRVKKEAMLRRRRRKRSRPMAS